MTKTLIISFSQDTIKILGSLSETLRNQPSGYVLMLGSAAVAIIASLIPAIMYLWIDTRRSRAQEKREKLAHRLSRLENLSEALVSVKQWANDIVSNLVFDTPFEEKQRIEFYGALTKHAETNFDMILNSINVYCPAAVEELPNFGAAFMKFKKITLIVTSLIGREEMEFQNKLPDLNSAIDDLNISISNLLDTTREHIHNLAY